MKADFYINSTTCAGSTAPQLLFERTECVAINELLLAGR